jgi:VIT1/CCC1 family predicted Fe2+/Mn2+ transporter
MTEPADRERLYRSVHALIENATPARLAFTRADWMAGLSVFTLVAATALPAGLPFFVVRDPQIALRLSNALLVGLLFLVGFRWARYVDLGPWRAGLTLAALGVLLVAVAIALGG